MYITQQKAHNQTEFCSQMICKMGWDDVISQKTGSLCNVTRIEDREKGF